MKGFGVGSPASNNKKIRERREAEMHKHVEDTVKQLRANMMIFGGKIRNEIDRIHKIDALEPVDYHARKRACRWLKMYLGQYRVISAMQENVEAIYDELKIREMTEEFGKSVEEITGLISEFNRGRLKPTKVFASLRKAVTPLQNGDQLKEYDKMYEELTHMYSNVDDETPDISDKWLEAVISGSVAWDSVPKMKDDDEDEDEVNKNDHTVKHVPTVSIKERTEKDLNRMLAGLGDSLTGDK